MGKEEIVAITFRVKTVSFGNKNVINFILNPEELQVFSQTICMMFDTKSLAEIWTKTGSDDEKQTLVFDWVGEWEPIPFGSDPKKTKSTKNFTFIFDNADDYKKIKESLTIFK